MITEHKLNRGSRNETIPPEEGWELLRAGQVKLDHRDPVVADGTWDGAEREGTQGTLMFHSLYAVNASAEMVKAYDHELAQAAPGAGLLKMKGLA